MAADIQVELEEDIGLVLTHLPFGAAAAADPTTTEQTKPILRA